MTFYLSSPYKSGLIGLLPSFSSSSHNIMVTMSILRPKNILAFALGGGHIHSMNEELGEDDIIIATIGSIGTGKSNFIDCLRNSDSVDTSYSPLASAGLASPSLAQKGRIIRPVRIHDHHIYGNSLVLLDTPGYDSINFLEADVLNMIKAFLKSSSPDSNLLLSGIISFHRISDNRIPEHQQNLNARMLSHLCLGKGLKRVVFMTTMWDKAKDDEKKQTFEKRLRGYRSHWEPLFQAGATHATFNNTHGSAWNVIASLLQRSQNASSRNIVPFPCSTSPTHEAAVDDDSSPATDSFTTTPTPTFHTLPTTFADTELPIFSPISPISVAINRTFPILSVITEPTSSSPAHLSNLIAGSTTCKPNDDAPANRPGANRPRLNIDLPRQMSRQSSATKSDSYAPTPCPLSPNTSHMWLLADRVYITSSLSVFEYGGPWKVYPQASDSVIRIVVTVHVLSS